MQKIVATTLASEFKVFSRDEFAQFNMHIPEKRLRPLDEKAVDALAESIKTEGMLAPILVADGGPRDRKNMHLLAGLHRLKAIEKLWDEAETEAERLGYLLTLRIVDVNPADRLLIEISENLHRKELTKDERKAFSAMWLKRTDLVISANGAKSNSNPRGSGRQRGWFTEWHEETGISEGTARRQWSEFSASRGTPDLVSGDATEEVRQEFADWILTKVAAPKPKVVRTKTPEQIERDAEILRRHALNQEQAVIAEEMSKLRTDGKRISGSTVNNVLKAAGLTTPRVKEKKMARPPAPTSTAPRIPDDWGTALGLIKAVILKFREKGTDPVDADLKELLAGLKGFLP